MIESMKRQIEELKVKRVELEDVEKFLISIAPQRKLSVTQKAHLERSYSTIKMKINAIEGVLLNYGEEV